LDYPPLVHYDTQEEYPKHFEGIYCSGGIRTFDDILVRFRKSKFDHCFFESTKRDARKDQFSVKRAERLDWIKAALQDPDSERYVGWDKYKKRYDKSRRVAIVMKNYVVVIQLKGAKNADFVTAYVADTTTSQGRVSTIEKIRKSPKWS